MLIVLVFMIFIVLLGNSYDRLCVAVCLIVCCLCCYGLGVLICDCGVCNCVLACGWDWFAFVVI